MGRLIEKMYGSYSDADLNDWERLPMNASVLTSSAFGAWLLRRDERRDTSIKADYENRLKADLVAMLEDLDLQIDESAAYNLEVAKVQRLIRDKINSLKEAKNG